MLEHLFTLCAMQDIFIQISLHHLLVGFSILISLYKGKESVAVCIYVITLVCCVTTAIQP